MDNDELQILCEQIRNELASLVNNHNGLVDCHNRLCEEVNELREENAGLKRRLSWAFGVSNKKPQKAEHEEAA